MKVGLVIDDHMGRPGGVQEYVRGLYHYLVSHGHEAVIFAGGGAGDGSERVVALGRSLSFRGSGSSTSVPLTLVAPAALRALLDREACDVLHVMAPYSPTLSGRLVAHSRATNLLTLLVALEPRWWARLLGVFARMQRRSLGRFAGRIAISPVAAATGEALYGGSYTLIPCGVDLAAFHPDESHSASLGDGRVTGAEALPSNTASGTSHQPNLGDGQETGAEALPSNTASGTSHQPSSGDGRATSVEASPSGTASGRSHQPNLGDGQETGAEAPLAKAASAASHQPNLGDGQETSGEASLVNTASIRSHQPVVDDGRATDTEASLARRAESNQPEQMIGGEVPLTRLPGAEPHQPNWVTSTKVPLANTASTRLHQPIVDDGRVVGAGAPLVNVAGAASYVPNVSEGRVTVLYVGRLEQRKGVVYLLRAYAALQHHYPDLRLVIAGDGPECPSLEHEAAVLGLRGVEFRGYVPAAELPALLRSADIFCAPATHAESFGIVLVEALASGLPVVAAGNPGYRWLLDRHPGNLVVRPRDPRQLAAAIATLADAPAYRRQLGRRNAAAAQQYGWEAIGAEIVGLYQTLIEQNKT